MRATGDPKNFNFKVGQVWRSVSVGGIREFRVVELSPGYTWLATPLHSEETPLRWDNDDEFKSTYQLDETSNAVQLLERYE